MTDEQNRDSSGIRADETDAPAHVDNDSNPDRSTKNFREKLDDALSGLKPGPGYIVTPIIMYLNVIIFIIMVITGVHIMEPDSESLLKWGANFRPMTLEGEWWRLITNCFLHIGIVHLLMNMYALLYIGMLLEPQIGKVRFGAAYLLSGVAASVTSLWWNSYTISAGASGAIFGMYGLFLALLLTNLIPKAARRELLLSIGIFVVYNLAYGLKGGIDNAAHIGGLVSGAIIGFAYFPGLKSNARPALPYLIILLLSVAVASVSFAALKTIPNDIGIYDQKINEFIENETRALEIYQMPDDTPDEIILVEIETNGLRYWNENIKILDELDMLDLPVDIQARNIMLRKYCDLRIKSYELISRAIAEGSDQYWGQLEEYNIEIEKIINELTGQE